MKSILSVTALVAVVTCYAMPSDAASVSLAGYVNKEASDYTGGGSYPSGSISIGGVNFDLTPLNGGTGFVQLYPTDYATDLGLTPLPSVTINVGQSGITTVYSIINSTFGFPNNLNGTVTFTGSGSATASFDLTQGSNIRDHNINNVFNQTAPGVLATAEYNGEVRFDVLKFVLPVEFSLETLVSITFAMADGAYYANGLPFVAAITTSTETSPVPVPAALTLFASALFGGGVVAWRKRKRQSLEKHNATN